jgi:hypothetical protein
MPTIAICTSANFYRQAVEIQAVIEKQGYTVIIPQTAEKMKKNGDYDASHYRTWLVNDKDYHKKTKLMHDHFDEIDKADAILVLAYEKHGIKNYIGGNVLMEMAMAFHQRKPIFVGNELPKESAYLEELLAMQPILLHDNFANFDKEYKKLT